MQLTSLVNPSVLTQPVYEPGKPIEEVARELGLDAATIIKLASNENPFGSSPRALQAAHAALENGELYPDGGCFALRQKLSQVWGLSPRQFVIGNGSNEILELLGHAFLRPGDEVVMGNPAFVVYKLVTLLFGAKAVGVFVGAPLLTAATSRMPRKAVLVALMIVFTLGNLACALAPNYELLMAARVITSLAHGTFFGVGAVVATGMVSEDRKASAISIMFTGLTVATLLGVPAGAWLGLQFGWRATFWAVTAIGVLATLIIATLVPADRSAPSPLPFRDELRVVARPQVLLGLLMTVLGFGGMFTVYTYIQPLLTQVTGFADAAVSPILLVFGVGMIVGNLLGGRFADRRLAPALLGTLTLLALVMGAMTFVLESPWAMIAFTGLLGAAAFATVSPLQLWVLQKASGAQSLASSLNIGAFNLGNALGAWLGGVVISQGLGLSALPWVAALVPASAFAVALWALALERRQRFPLVAEADCA